MSQDNIGRDLPLKTAFANHWVKAMGEILPVTRELENLIARKPEHRAYIVADRMIDDVEKLLAKYHQSEKDGEYGIHAPLPVMLIAFAKDNNPISKDRGRASARWEYVQLDCSGDKSAPFYKWRLDYVEKRVQIAFFAKTSESAKSITSQMRLFLQRFQNYRFPVTWHFGGYDFNLTATIQEIPVVDMVADLPNRQNLTVLTWDLIVEFQIPYIQAPRPLMIIQDGKHKGKYQGFPDILQEVSGNIKIRANTLLKDTFHQQNKN